MAKLLLIQCAESAEREIRQILVPMKVKPVLVPRERFHLTLEELAKEKKEDGFFGGTYPDGSAVVMCNFTERQIDRFLMDMRNKGVQVDFKAVLTPVNRSWNVMQLYFELQREKIIYERMRRDRRK